MDLRVEKTKRGIVNAFLELRAKKPLEKITVKELCQRAMIHKSTFYSHYADVYALSETLEREVVASILEGIAKPEAVFEDPAAFTRELMLGYLAQENLLATLFSGDASGRLARRLEESIKALAFSAYPQYRDDPARNTALSYCIHGGYHTFLENKRYGAETVAPLIAQLSRAGMELGRPAPAREDVGDAEPASPTR